MEQHGGIPEQRQELFGEVLTHLNNSSQPFVCFRLTPSAAQGEHTHQLVLMRCTTGYGARAKVMLVFGETILVYPKSWVYVLTQLMPLQENLSQSAV